MKKISERLYSTKLSDTQVVFDVFTSKIYAISSDEPLIDESFLDENFIISPKPFPTHKIECTALIISCAETCNLRCTYCYANDGTYNTKEQKIMKDIDYDLLLEKLLQQKIPLKSLSLFGGEPLLGFKYIVNFIEKLDIEYKKKHWAMPTIGIVTNGTLINKLVIDFFNKYNVNVSISIDGDKSINDMNRLHQNPNISVYDTVIKCLCEIHDRKFPLIASATVSRKIITQYKKGDYSKALDHFKKIGFDYVAHFIADENIPLNDIEIEHIQQFAIEQVEVTFKRLLSNDLNVPFSVLGIIDTIVKQKYKPECGAGINQLFWSSHGEIYPCQTYYMPKIKNRKNIHRTEIPSCKDCFCVNICNSYCPGGSVLALGAESEVIPSRCVYQKALVEAIILNLYYYFILEKNQNIKSRIIKNICSIARGKL